MALPAAPPVPAADYDSPVDRLTRRRDRAVRRAATRSRWWWAPAIVALTLLSLWGALRADQFLSGVMVWPRQGARFVEINQGLPTSRPDAAHGGSMTVVISGLNTKSGTAVATALLPVLSQDGGRVFSLIYGSSIADEDVVAKYDALVDEVQPQEVTFFGSSMGGDIALNLAAHAHRLRTQAVDARAAASASEPESAWGSARSGVGWPAPSDGPTGAPAAEGGATESAAPTQPGGLVPVLPPRVRTVWLDCTPLGADDVRDRSRTSADVLTALTEAGGTDGGAATRVAVEVAVQRNQWSTGLLPAVTVRWDDLRFKYDQVMREKISSPGISTSLVKDQYGVIRRMDADVRFAELATGTEPVRIVYFRPVDASADTVVAVDRVTRELDRLSVDHRIPVRIVGVPGGHHASAQSDPDAYLDALASPFPGRLVSGDPGDVTVLASGPG